MESISRNVRDIPTDERSVYEKALGLKLQENQQIILQVITLGTDRPEAGNETTQPASGLLPDWCHVYEGLSDEEIEEMETVILDRSGWSRNPQ